jgi:hypothetical protein
MDKTTSGRTAVALQSPGSGPCTTVVAGSVTDPKLPVFVGDSWRPAVAGLLGAVPLAVAAAAMTGASLMGSAAASPHAGAVTAQDCVTTVTAGALGGQLKYPACLGD